MGDGWGGMTVSLETVYPEGVKALRELFGSSLCESHLPRLNDIFKVCESAWERNIARLENRRIRYLLIAEAAPWTDEGIHPRYFYETLDGAWGGRVIRAFFEVRPGSIEQCLQALAQEGFLLVDTLPFAMRYSTTLRKTATYLRLLSATRQYFLSKLGDPRIPWSADTRVAIAFRWHGLRVIEAYREGIRLPSGQLIVFNENQIASDGSGYTNSDLLKKIWKIRDDAIRA